MKTKTKKKRSHTKKAVKKSNGDRPSLQQMRALWRPKREEMPEQCVSCPFRPAGPAPDGNDAEFRAVLEKVAESGDIETPGGVDIDFARRTIREDTSRFGDFMCHQSALDPKRGMRERDRSQHRQCPGASAHYRSGAGVDDS